jgi:hypothetical protein
MWEHVKYNMDTNLPHLVWKRRIWALKEHFN